MSVFTKADFCNYILSKNVNLPYTAFATEKDASREVSKAILEIKTNPEKYLNNTDVMIALEYLNCLHDPKMIKYVSGLDSIFWIYNSPINGKQLWMSLRELIEVLPD